MAIYSICLPTYSPLHLSVIIHCSLSVALGFSDIFDVLPHFLAYIREQAIIVPAPIIARASVKMAIVIHSKSVLHESPTTDVGCL